MKILLFSLLCFVLPLYASAQYNYQDGLLSVNGIIFQVHKYATETSLTNSANILSTTPSLNASAHESCEDADFDKLGQVVIEQTFCQVFPVARRATFANKRYLYVSIYADNAGKIKEVDFMFPTGSPITPQELYQVETSLKALPPLSYLYKGDCSGVNYHLSGYTFYIDEGKLWR